jgi:hypothetical protein
VVTGRKSHSRRDDPPTTPAGAAPRILVVEDDLDLGETVCEILSVSGYRASHATDGLVALEGPDDAADGRVGISRSAAPRPAAQGYSGGSAFGDG